MGSYAYDNMKNIMESMLIEHLTSLKVNDKESLTKFYDEFASNEDEDMKAAGYGGPAQCARLINEYYNEKNARILDCGVGSGMVGAELMKYGFTNMDGNDLSTKSLEVAKEKSIYKNLIAGDLSQLKDKVPENSYDGLVSVGCFAPGHMTAVIFPDWIRVVKPGGYIINLLRAEHLDVTPEHSDGKLEGAIKNIENEGKWKYIKKVTYPNHFIGRDGVALICQVC